MVFVVVEDQGIRLCVYVCVWYWSFQRCQAEEVLLSHCAFLFCFCSLSLSLSLSLGVAVFFFAPPQCPPPSSLPSSVCHTDSSNLLQVHQTVVVRAYKTQSKLPILSYKSNVLASSSSSSFCAKLIAMNPLTIVVLEPVARLSRVASSFINFRIQLTVHHYSPRIAS
jgi:hypothetical protein